MYLAGCYARYIEISGIISRFNLSIEISRVNLRAGLLIGARAMTHNPWPHFPNFAPTGWCRSGQQFLGFLCNSSACC